MKARKMVMTLCVIVIVVSFFLPWISVESSAVGSVSKILTGKKQVVVDVVSGFKVPVIANSEESRFMINVIRIFEPGIKDADKKSFLIWLVPVLAVLLLRLNNSFKRNRWIQLLIGLICTSIFALALYKITTTDLNKWVLKVNIAYGLWLTLCGYLVMGITGILYFLKLCKK